MRKSFTILTGIFVCVLTMMGGARRAKALTPESSSIVPPVALSLLDLAARMVQAKQLLQLTSSVSTKNVELAVLDPQSAQLNVLSLSKDGFLTRDAMLSATTSSGRKVEVHVIRANGVNTAVDVTDTESHQPLVPLVVQFPIVKNGGISEVAYYTSAHPALLSPQLTSSGQSYIRTMLDHAAASLTAQGESVPSDIVDVAEHLCVVEHTDHKRFMTEDHAALFPEILALYALNEGNTFRYSVSTAGAGGMIQMIPRTYDGIRQQHKNVSLNSEFVSGMRDHANALEAMLLYMNDTWTGLAKNPEVQDALKSGIATKAELLAAGYNSNPMRLPGYLKNGGAEWRSRIPAETQIYLKIYSGVENTLHLTSAQTSESDGSSAGNGFAMSLDAEDSLSIGSWLRAPLFNSEILALLR